MTALTILSTHRKSSYPLLYQGYADLAQYIKALMFIFKSSDIPKEPRMFHSDKPLGTWQVFLNSELSWLRCLTCQLTVHLMKSITLEVIGHLEVIYNIECNSLQRIIFIIQL